MAFERIGLGAVLTFDGGQFVRGIKAPRDELGRFMSTGERVPPMLMKIKTAGTSAFAKMGADISKVATGIGQLGGAARNAAFAMTPLTAGVGFAASKFIDFNAQMAIVKSIGGATGEEMKAFTKTAKHLGATTQFTATEAGQGLENLRRAGFSTSEALGAISSTLNLAAADSIDLATASDITAQVIRSMGLSAEKDSNRVADVLAKTSAASNTNVISLGESFKYAAAQAHNMGIDLETTAAAIGVIADAGIRGSSGGTSFTNMLVQMANPSKKALAFMEKHKMAIQENKDGTLNLLETFKRFGPVFRDIHSRTERAAIITEIFGIRGQKAVSAIDQAILNDKFPTLIQQLKDAKGTAQDMANMRLDSFKGQWTILMSAIEGFAIELMDGPFGDLKVLIQDTIIPSITNVVLAMQELKESILTTDIAKIEAKYGKTATAIAMGIMDAIAAMKEGWRYLQDKFKQLAQKFGMTFGADGTRKIAKWVTMFVMIGAAAGPILLALLGIAFVVTSVIIPAISGIAAIVSGAFVPILILGGILAAIWMFTRAEGESFRETMVRTWHEVKAAALDFWNNVLKPIWKGMKEGYEVIAPQLAIIFKKSVDLIKTAFIDLFRAFGVEMDVGKDGWQQFGRTAVIWIGRVVAAMVGLITYIVIMFVTLIKLVKGWALSFADFFVAPFVIVYKLIEQVFNGMAMIFSGDMIEGFKTIGTAILNFVLEPLRMILRAAIRIADAVSVDIPEAVRSFANEGFVLEALKTEAPKVSFGKRGSPGFISPDEITQQQAQNSAEANAVNTDAIMEEVSRLSQGVADGIKSGMETAKPPCIENTVDVKLDGKSLGRSVAKNEQELKDRSGFRTTPWQRRMAAEHGASAVRK